MIRLRTALAPILAAAALASAATDWKAQEYTTADGGLGVPTTRWCGETYAGGKLAVLVFIVEPIHHHECRRPMELKRVLGCHLDYVHITDYKHQVDNDRARALLDGRRWDCIVVWNRQEWNTTYHWLADDVKFRVLQQVGDGAGLLITDRAPKEVLRKDRQTEPPVRSLVGGLALTGRFALDD